MLAVPDPPQLFLTALENTESQGLAVDICIHADPALADTFDGAGRPRPEIWGTRVIDIPRPDEQIRLLPRPADAAELVAGLLTGAASNPNSYAFGSAIPK